MREIIFGKRRTWRYWQITTDITKLPDNSTWYVMTNLSDAPHAVIGNNYGLRTWVEYGFKLFVCKGFTMVHFLMTTNQSLIDYVNSQQLVDPLVCLGDGHDGVWNLVREFGQDQFSLCSIGSGAVESGIKQIGLRIKISGAQSNVESVNHILSERLRLS